MLGSLKGADGGFSGWFCQGAGHTGSTCTAVSTPCCWARSSPAGLADRGAAGLFTARHDFPGKAIVAVLPLATLVVPEVIAAQTWLMVLGNNGLVSNFAGRRGPRAAQLLWLDGLVF
jgi:hypothetical protein